MGSFCRSRTDDLYDAQSDKICRASLMFLENLRFSSSIFISPYFFSAKSFQNLKIETIELDKIYRQSDTEFIHLLNAIRNDQCRPEDLDYINGRLDKKFCFMPDSLHMYRHGPRKN